MCIAATKHDVMSLVRDGGKDDIRIERWCYYYYYYYLGHHFYTDLGIQAGPWTKVLINKILGRSHIFRCQEIYTDADKVSRGRLAFS